MSSVSTQKVMRMVNLRLSGFYQYLHLIFGTKTYQNIQPSEETVRTGTELFTILRLRRDDAGYGLDRARELLSKCSEFETLVYVIDDDGYNAIQTAILYGDINFVKLLVDEGWNINAGKCCLPLHLACKIGNVAIVELILRAGADPEVKTGMCYPRRHVPIQHVPSRFHFLETDIFACDSNHEPAIMYAIQDDHVEIVHSLMELTSNVLAYYVWPCQQNLLHYACANGAYESVRYLAVASAGQLNSCDDDGMTPLLHSVQWGRRFIQLLVESGAETQSVNNASQTALHILLGKIRDPSDLYECSKFLLACGLEQNINAVDQSGNTALHVAIELVNLKIPADGGGSQEDFDDQALRTMSLLLKHNCDPDVLNSSGVTALHKLILTFDFVVSNDPSGVTLETLPVRERYRADINLFRRAMEILLVNGASPHLVTCAGRRPLVMLLNTILDISRNRLSALGDGLLACLDLLCSHGAQPSHDLAMHVEVVSILAKFGHCCLSQRDDVMREAMSVYLDRVVALLLNRGLEANHSSTTLRREADGRSGNILVELARLAQFPRTPSDLVHLHRWLLTCLRCGANPDIEPYPSEHVICHSQSSIFLKPKGTQPVNQYMYQIQDLMQPLECGGHAKRILMLFYNSMGHDALYQCLGTAKFMSRFNGDRIPSRVFLKTIDSLASNPRSLKQNARVMVYRALGRRIEAGVPSLPLPRAIQAYLMDIE